MDLDALSTARENVASVEMEDEISLLHRQIATSAETATSKEVELFTPQAPELTEEIEEENEDGLVEKRSRKIDTVVMNPPFGSWNKGIDMVFLETACKVSNDLCLYSLVLADSPLPTDRPHRRLLAEQVVDSGLYRTESQAVRLRGRGHRRDEGTSLLLD